MQEHIKKIALLSCLGIGMFAGVWFESAHNEAFAAITDNTTGWAWSSTVGWISFNCTNEGTCPPAPGSVNYGVHVDPVTGNFTGYAWSSGAGWIKFNPDVAISIPPSAVPPDVSYPFAAKLDLDGTVCGAVNDVCGWARACAAVLNKVTCEGVADPLADPWDGWIKLRGKTVPGDVDYGVKWNSATQELEGWAWGSNVVGWVSFNAVNCDTDGNGFTDVACGGDNVTTPVVDYFVGVDIVNDPPTAINLDVDSPTGLEYCGRGSPPVRVRWNFIDRDPWDRQSAYQIQVDDDVNFSPDPLDLSPPRDTGKRISPAAPNCPSGKFCTVFSLDWNKTYYWRLKVWDNGSPSLESDWVYPPSVWVFPPFPLVLPLTPAPGTPFETPSYAYPDPIRFSYTPVAPRIGESVRFFDDDEGALGNSFDGDPFEPDVFPPERVIATWEWNFGDGDISSVADPTHIYANPGTYIVTLTVTDEMSNPSVTATCLAEKGVTVVAPQGPKWQETSPF